MVQKSLDTTGSTLNVECQIPSVILHTDRFGYEGCPESIRPFWVSPEPVAWPWCNLAASQRRPHCVSVNSHSPVGLVSRQWDAVDWACALCDLRIHNDRASRSASSRKCARPFHNSREGSFGEASHNPGLSASPYSPDSVPCEFCLFPKLNSPLKVRILNETDTQYTNVLSVTNPMQKMSLST